jgi:DnaJ-class molecular chaperone
MEFRDYYTTLGLDKTASAADIKKAYRRLARKYHPDLNAGNKTAEAKFKEINEANEVLGTPETRRKYDELGANWKMYEQAGAEGGPGGRGRPGAGGGGPRHRTTARPGETHAQFDPDDPFSDFFHAFFGGGAFAGAGAGRIPRGGPPPRGQDLEHGIDLTLEEVFTGTSRRLRLSQEGGADRTVEVRIPAGVTDGARVRASGEGGAGGRTRGDLYLKVRVLPHPRFERRGQDLHVRVPIPVTTAVLGGEVSVPTLGESTLRLKIPPMTNGGRVFRLRAHGLPAVGKADSRGDLYATIDLQIPDRVSPDAREHYEALRRLEAEGVPS